MPSVSGSRDITNVELSNFSASPLLCKIIKNRLYPTPLGEYASSFDEDNDENCGKSLPRYAELYQGNGIESTHEMHVILARCPQNLQTEVLA